MVVGCGTFPDVQKGIVLHVVPFDNECKEVNSLLLLKLLSASEQMKGHSDMI